MPQGAAFDLPTMTPLAPSVEKAYYRKCIQLKRRLNEVESANDEAKLRRLRLDRAIMKMRLERAFLLDELRKRMDQDVDGSDASGDEGMATPPPDRPHRDKRRRPQASQPAASAAAPPANSLQTTARTPSAQRVASEPNANTDASTEVGGNATEDGKTTSVEQAAPGQTPHTSETPALSHGSPHGPVPTGTSSGAAANGMDIDGPNNQDDRPISREAGAIGERIGTGPTVVEENGERRVTSTSGADPDVDGEDGSR